MATEQLITTNEISNSAEYSFASSTVIRINPTNMVRVSAMLAIVAKFRPGPGRWGFSIKRKNVNVMLVILATAT